MKKAYIFPGQGSQYPGMAEHLYNENELARALFDKANETLGFDITEVMFRGTAEQLKQTDVTQPALVAAGAIDFEDGLRLVAIRARAMQKACELQPGTMAAVLMLPSEKIEEICAGINSSNSGIVVAANYNCEGQVVISGTREAVELACTKCKEAGARRALTLPVGGAFHSPLMQPAASELANCIESTLFKKPICAIYQNVTATPTTDPKVIKTNILAQLTAPVRWTQTVRNMVADGADSFIEIGPGKVLQGLTAKIISSEITISGIE